MICCSRKSIHPRACCSIALLVAILFASPFAIAESIAGRWAAGGKILANGVQEKFIFDVTQKADKLTASFESMGFVSYGTGKLMGKHFEIWRSGADYDKPYLVGDLVNNELHLTIWGSSYVMHPAKPDDEIAKPAYVAPPALHAVVANGLAMTPPMGWNSWNLFADKVDDATVRTMADAMVSSGMRDAGYVYVNIDDTWQGVRDKNGVLQPNSKFPDMKALADYVHSKGLKIGIYSSPGPATCAGYPGSYAQEVIDAKTYAAWGIDYLKYDWCSAQTIYSKKELHPVYQRMADALRATGRPIVYSLCEYGWDDVEKWGADVSGNLWRTTDDIRDEWSSMIDNIELQVKTAPYAGPGHWNDPDMLEVGNGHMTTTEYQTHMSLWALTAAPLLAGNDIRKMSEDTRAILLNKEVIAVDQDPLGRQASPIREGKIERWAKPLADGGVAVGIVNLGDSAVTVTLHEADFKLSSPVKDLRDLWAHQVVTFQNGSYTATISSHGTLLLRAAIH